MPCPRLPCLNSGCTTIGTVSSAASVPFAVVPWRFPGAWIVRSLPRRRNLALGDRAVAITAVSASLAEGELDAAVEIARQIGIRHQIIATQEFDRTDYVRNAPDRCYHCKTELYTRLEESGRAAVTSR